MSVAMLAPQTKPLLALADVFGHPSVGQIPTVNPVWFDTMTVQRSVALLAVEARS